MIHARVKSGKLRKLAWGLFTTNKTEEDTRIIRRNIWDIVGHYFPDAIISDRTALENGPAPDGSIFIISERRTNLELPGHKIRPRNGHPPSSDDRPFFKIRMCSQARAILENMRASRSRDGNVARTFSQKEMEEWLVGLIQTSGTEPLQKLRDQARRISKETGQHEEFAAFNLLLGSILGTQTHPLESRRGQDFSADHGVDTTRIDLFETLRQALAINCPPGKPRRNEADERLLPFFEAYFSNYIEGTRFPIETAKNIVFEGFIPAARPSDAHDIIGTFHLLNARGYQNPQYNDFPSFVQYLKSSHAAIAGHRADIRPGEFKTSANSAGSTVFVRPELVLGTLEKGWEFLSSLSPGLPRGIFASFLVSEVHPFDDGNGRVARAVLNQELSETNLSPIIIPTIFRADYIQSLKALTADARTTPYIRAMDKASRYTHAVDFSDYETSRQILFSTNAFVEPEVAVNEGILLKIPDSDIEWMPGEGQVTLR